MKELKDNWIILVVMSMINGLILWNFISNGKTIHGIGYCIFFYVSILTIHYFTSKIPPQNAIYVKNPKRELLITILFVAIGIVFLVLNLYIKSHNQQLGFIIKLPILLGMLICTFPVGIAIYLLLQKYKFTQIGFSFKPFSYLLLGVLIWGLTGIFAFLFNKSGIIWEEGFKELGGVSGLLWQGFIMAGLAEEFSRFIMQTRLERYIKVNGFNILIATTIWAFMHFPINYFKGNPVPDILFYCIQIIPLGCIWGYMTHRTKSIVPSTMAHGLNLWGFQNS